MDTKIPFGRDEDGNVTMQSIRDVLADLKSHDDLVQAMNECFLTNASCRQRLARLFRVGRSPS